MILKLQQAKAEFERLTAEYGAEAFMRCRAKRTALAQKEAAQKQLAKRCEKPSIASRNSNKSGAEVPARVPVAIATGKDVVKLDPERKLLTNLVKMVAYQAESDLVHLVSRHYKRRFR